LKLLLASSSHPQRQFGSIPDQIIHVDIYANISVFVIAIHMNVNTSY